MKSRGVLTDSERWALESFRRAASQVRSASIMVQRQRVEIHTAPGKPGYVDVYVRLLGAEPFRSLAAAIRLVYQQREPAHFTSVCNLLARYASPDVRQHVADLRERYLSIFRDPAGGVDIGDGLEPARFTAREVFEHWLYGVVFHQDEEREAAVRRLTSTGALFPWSVQVTALEIAERIIALDDVVAGFLAESGMPQAHSPSVAAE